MLKNADRNFRSDKNQQERQQQQRCSSFIAYRFIKVVDAIMQHLLQHR
jgi:hypothetical protein